jgi:hypothetical protein
MNTKQMQHRWRAQLTVFSEENLGRLTRLGVFEPAREGMMDYWLENGLPLLEVVLEEHNGSRSIEIILDGFTHTIRQAKRLELLFGDETEDGLNVIDANGTTSVLRFEENGH